MIMQLSILDRVIDKLEQASLSWASTEVGIKRERGSLYREVNGISGCKPRAHLSSSRENLHFPLRLQQSRREVVSRSSVLSK